MSVIVLVDYKNVRNGGMHLKDVIGEIVRDESQCFPEFSDVNSAKLGRKIRIRLYGGWYSGTSATSERSDAVGDLTGNMPTIMKSDAGLWSIRTEFSDQIVRVDNHGAPSFDVRDTVKIRKTVGRDFIINSNHQCTEGNCQISAIKKWVKSRKGCTNNGCTKEFSDVFSRTEQKQVDTHLALDFYRLCVESNSISSVWLLCNDVDVFPAVLSVMLREIKIRVNLFFTQNVSWASDPRLAEHGIKVIKGF